MGKLNEERTDREKGKDFPAESKERKKSHSRLFCPVCKAPLKSCIVYDNVEDEYRKAWICECETSDLFDNEDSYAGIVLPSPRKLPWNSEEDSADNTYIQVNRFLKGGY